MTSAIRVLVLKDGDIFVAQCLEYDIAAQGRSEDEAKRRLLISLKAERAEARDRGEAEITLAPAPKAFHAIYASDDISRTEVTLAAA
jgi:hypothetical protein